MNQALVNSQIAAVVTASESGKAVTTSFAVAEVFGKRHANVLRAIRDLSDGADSQVVDFIGLNLCLRHIDRVDVAGKAFTEPYYELTRDGFVMLVMGFTGSKARIFKVEYINAFNAMEQRITQSLLGKESERVIFLTKQVLQNDETMRLARKAVDRLEIKLNKAISKFTVPVEKKTKVEPPTMEERQEIMEQVEEYIKDKHFFEVLEVKKALGLPVSATILSKWFTHRYGPSRVTMHKCAWRRVYTNPLVKAE